MVFVKLSIGKSNNDWYCRFGDFVLNDPPPKNATKFPEKCSVSFLKTRWMQGRRGRHQHRPPPALPGILCRGNCTYLQRSLCDPHWERHLGVEMEGDCDKFVEEEGGGLAVGGSVICILVFRLALLLPTLTRSARLLQRIFQMSVPPPNWCCR